jgi:hypothetical protein
MAEANLDASELMAHLEMKVTVHRFKEFKFRCWIASLFLRLAAKIAGMGITISIEHKDNGRNYNRQ